MRTLVISFALLAAIFSNSSRFVGDDKQPEKPDAKVKKGPLTDARARLLKGNYEEARALFSEAAKTEADRGAAALGIAASFRETGDYEKSLAALDEAIKDRPKDAFLLANRGDLLFELGRWDGALADATAALAIDKDNSMARWTKARVERDQGKVKEADQGMRLIVRKYTARNQADDPITDIDELLVVAQAGAEHARWNQLPKQFNFILNDLIDDDILSHERDQWHAEVLAGMLLVEKYNFRDSPKAFDRALAINPKAVDAMVGKGLIAYQKFEMKDAEIWADRALKINSKHVGALRLKADALLVAGDIALAEKQLQRARNVNPRDAAVLGRLAAIDQLTRRTTEFEKIVKEAESYDAKPAAFYFELAECLNDRKRYIQAEKYYKKAAELRPLLPGPHNGLGMLYLRLGKEKEGREILVKALETDPFNLRVSNSLKVLNHLDHYAVISTEHYELRYDPEKDKILAAFIAEMLEETHAELKKQFNYAPSEKILIEVFSDHEMFSGRTIGLPDLHTIGACTGKVVTMAAPKAKHLAMKPLFNWSRVIRHELTHIFNLAQSEYQCPHWLTEGLAVRNENMARPMTWAVILRDKYAADELFNLDTVMFGFVRPKNPDEWQLAYCQSQIYVEYLLKTHGEACIGKLLDAYREGKDTNEALKAACGVEKDAFEKGYREYVKEIVKGYRATTVKKEKPLTFAELEEEQKKNEEDPDLAARLAEQYFLRNRAADARKLVDAALDKKPGHPLASIVKARLLASAGEDESALSLLDDALKVNPDYPRLLLTIGKIRLDAKNYEEAAKVLERGRKIASLDGDWLEQLAQIYKVSNDTEKLVSVLKEIVGQDPDEIEGRIRMAKAYLEAAKPSDAERFAREALQIDVESEEARKIMIAALKAQNKSAEIEKLEKRFETK